MEILGIDVGGTGIKGAIVNVETGTLVTEKYRIPTPEGAKPADVADVIDQLVKHFNWTGKVGCGFPAIISHGTALSSGNIDKNWRGTNVEELFSKRTGLDFKVANDADVASIAEMHFGIGKGVDGTVITITIGTGIGSGLFCDGMLVPNVELGHMSYKKYKAIEHFAADSARKRENLTYEEWGKRLNKFLKLVELMFSPDLIILGGGASKKLDKYKDQLTVKVPVVAAQFENNAGIVGAALTVEEKSIH
jgi:polyphosphate glucokinase